MVVSEIAGYHAAGHGLVDSLFVDRNAYETEEAVHAAAVEDRLAALQNVMAAALDGCVALAAAAEMSLVPTPSGQLAETEPDSLGIVLGRSFDDTPQT